MARVDRRDPLPDGAASRGTGREIKTVARDRAGRYHLRTLKGYIAVTDYDRHGMLVWHNGNVFKAAAS